MVDIEVYSYTVLASIMGMLVVFGFLWFLSILMTVLVKIFEDKEPVIREAFTGTGSTGAAEAWVLAAAAAFLSEEELECSVSAASWGPGGNEKNDPWMSSPKLPRKRYGV